MTDERAERVRNSLPATQWAVELLSPAEWRHVAEFLMGLLSRRPMVSTTDPSGEWSAERLILGCLASELGANAREAGELPAEPMTLVNDPLGPARTLVREMEQHQHERERQEELDRGTSAARSARVLERWSSS